jgi:hypothetical protein
MRFALILLLCCTSLSVSAQWWRIKIDLKRHERYALLPRPADHSVDAIIINTSINAPELPHIDLNLSNYSLELAEASVMKSAQHNMRYRVYGTASYNFSDLAQLYVQQNRLSEAKWYYLQSNNIARKENDDKHVISNLMGLAMIKARLGDFTSSAKDLSEAKNIARLHGLKTEEAAVEKEIKYIRDNKTALAKTESHYAETVDTLLKHTH